MLVAINYEGKPIITKEFANYYDVLQWIVHFQAQKDTSYFTRLWESNDVEEAISRAKEFEKLGVDGVAGYFFDLAKGLKSGYTVLDDGQMEWAYFKKTELKSVSMLNELLWEACMADYSLVEE